MKPTEVAITRKFNVGNYESIAVHVTASLMEGEDAVKALHELEKLIMDYWSGRTPSLVAKQLGKAEK